MPDTEEFVAVMGEMKDSFASVRDIVRSTLVKAQSMTENDVKNGISLLSQRNDTLLSYLASMVLMSAHRVLGHSLLSRDLPTSGFDDPERRARGTEAGDLVDSAIEARAVLEKTKALELRLKYQIQKLVRLAEDASVANQDVTQDLLAFRPNIQDFVTSGTGDDAAHDAQEIDTNEGVYRPPKLAPVPYLETAPKDRTKRKVPLPTALDALVHFDPSAPFSESTSGLGGGTATSHSVVHARLDHMTKYEEDHMMRLVLNKKEAKRRKQDETNIALGGMGGTGRGGELQDEFADILKSVNRKRGAKIGDGYEELRQRGKRANAFARSQMRMVGNVEGDSRPQKRTRH